MNLNLIKNRIKYDPETGKCYWIFKNKFHPRLFGTEAGSIAAGRHGSRVQIKINSKLYKRSRIAFVLMTGKKPGIVDHINGNTMDDRWINLREVNASQNNWNMGKRNKKSKLPVGVRLLPSGMFQTRIAAHKKTYNIGVFPNINCATAAYLKAKQKLHGEYARSSNGNC